LRRKIDELESLKAGIQATPAIKIKLGRRKVRYRGLTKTTPQLQTLSALSNLRMARHQFGGLKASEYNYKARKLRRRRKKHAAKRAKTKCQQRSWLNTPRQNEPCTDASPCAELL